MKLAKVQKLLDAKIHTGAERIDKLEVKDAFGSDLMSDVLAFVQEQGMLLTGLRNSQVVRTAEMMDMQVVVFVRGKEPDAEMISVAEERGIVLLSTEKTMFNACGILYKNGLDPEGKEGDDLV